MKRLILWLAVLWVSISTLYLFSGLLITLHSEAGIVELFQKIEPWEVITAMATAASAVAAFMSYEASVKASEIASKIGLIDRRIENYHAFLALKHHMTQNSYWASEGEVSKYYYHSINSNFLFSETLSEKITKYYDACFNAAMNHSEIGHSANQTTKGQEAMKVVDKLSPEIEKEILNSLK